MTKRLSLLQLGDGAGLQGEVARAVAEALPAPAGRAMLTSLKTEDTGGRQFGWKNSAWRAS